MKHSGKPRAAAPMLSESAEALLTFLRAIPPENRTCEECAAISIGAGRTAMRELIVNGAILCSLGDCAICAEWRLVAQVRPMTECAFCHRPILPTASKTTIQEVAYHTGCWDQKVRPGRPEEAVMPKPPDRVDDAQRAQAIREKIALGHLPRMPPAKMYVGPGTGGPCAACGLVVERDHAEYELLDIDATALRMHRECFEVWANELKRRA